MHFQGERELLAVGSGYVEGAASFDAYCCATKCYNKISTSTELKYGEEMRILENRGNWYKGNLHMHTTVSDGALDPVEAINIYREAGYDFIAITDHR